MGLRDTFQGAAATIQAAFGDVFVPTRFLSVRTATYDVSAGAVTAGTKAYMTTMVFEMYSHREIDDENIRPTDMKGTVAQANLVPVPTLRDRVVREEEGCDPIEYDIVDIAKDPADATWVFQLRRS